MNIKQFMETRGTPKAKNIRARIETALGTMQMRQLEQEIGGNIVDTISDLVEYAFGHGEEGAGVLAWRENQERAEYRKESMVKAFMSDEARAMTPEQRELHALRAFAGIDVRFLKDAG